MVIPFITEEDGGIVVFVADDSAYGLVHHCGGLQVVPFPAAQNFSLNNAIRDSSSSYIHQYHHILSLQEDWKARPNTAVLASPSFLAISTIAILTTITVINSSQD